MATKLFRFHTQLNHGQRWNDYDILAANLRDAVKKAEKIMQTHEGPLAKGKKVVELTDVEVLSYNVRNG